MALGLLTRVFRPKPRTPVALPLATPRPAANGLVRLHKMDLKAEIAGVPVPYKPQPGIVVWLARMNNPEMIRWQHGPSGKARLRELQQTHTPEEAADVWFRESVAEFVVTGWSGMAADEGDGERVYSLEDSIQLMTDPRRYQWQDFVASESSDLTRYVEREKADAEKNSGTA